MHSATASGPNSVNAGLHLVTLRSNQACRTKDLSKWSVDVCQWSTPNLFQKENVKCPKKSMAAVLTLLFDHFQTSMTKYSHLLVAIIYILSVLSVLIYCVGQKPKMKCVFCLSHQKASLDNVVVFMWLCKVVIKFRTFEEDHPANTIWGWTCNQMFRTTRNAQLGWWQMVKSRVGMHTRYSVSEPTWDTRLGVKRTGQLESKSAVSESCK